MHATLQQKRNMAYELASRHSATVVMLRRAVPAAALAMFVILVFLLVFLRPGSVADIAGIQLDGLTIDNGNLVMSNPRLEGVADAGRAYILEARRAVQAGPNADLIELENIEARIAMDGGLTGTLEAVSGLYERQANRLKLTERSVFRRSDGIEAFFQSADIDVETGSMVSDEPVRVVRPGQEIRAGSASITDNGKRLLFDKGVRVAVQPTNAGDDTGETR